MKYDGYKTDLTNNKRERWIIFTSKLVLTPLVVIIALLTLGFSCAQKNIAIREESTKQQGTIDAPSTNPEETAKTLYSDTTFFNLRNRISLDVIGYLSPCLTPELENHLKIFNKDLEMWSNKNKNSNLKPPIREGPIFLSNYEGADSHKIGQANIDGQVAKVPISFLLDDVGESFEWQDFAILKKVGEVWLLDDIYFDPDRYDNHTLLKNTVVFSK